MTTASSLETINQAIEENNPFESQFVVKSQHVWDETFPDVPSLHQAASDAILGTIEKINANKQKDQTTGFAIIAPKGSGKTHVLSRVRRSVKEKGNGCFIYMCEYGNLSQIRCQFLQALAASLKKSGGTGAMQWQELATILVNQALNQPLSVQQFIARFPRVLAQRPDFIDLMTGRIAQNHPNVDNPYIIRAIIWTLSQAHAAFAINWLAGREISDAQAKLMGLPNPSKDDKEVEAFNTACQILNLLGKYTTPVVCFDELDGAEVADESDPMLGGFNRALVVASLEKDVYNNLNRGVLLAGMYARTWQDEFQSARTLTGVGDRIAHEKLELNPLKEQDAVELVSTWLNEFYTQQNLTPPYPIYPFEENQLREIGAGATVREVLRWCAENFTSKGADPSTRLEKAYQSIENSLSDYLDDNQKIAAALAFGLKHLKGKKVEGVTIDELDREVRPSYRHRGKINFRILGTENGKPVKIGVAVSQDSNGKTVGAMLKHLNDYQAFDLTRGCLIRSKKIADHWQVANTNLDKLLHQQGGEWISLKDEEIKPLLILHQMYKEIDRDMFSEEVFLQFVEEKHPFAENLLIREILSDPSGQAPEEVSDEDAELEQLLSDTALSDSTEDAELSELLSVA